jgi:hypothetical protein
MLEFVGRPAKLRMAGAVYFHEPPEVSSDDGQGIAYVSMMVVEKVIDKATNGPVPRVFVSRECSRQFRELVEDRFEGYTGDTTRVSQRLSPRTAKVDTEALEDCCSAEICCDQVPDNIGLVLLSHDVVPSTSTGSCFTTILSKDAANDFVKE